jgi:hypothetical protein
MGHALGAALEESGEDGGELGGLQAADAAGPGVCSRAAEHRWNERTPMTCRSGR